MKKIPISFNLEMEAKEKELANLLGLSGTYGEVPNVVRFSINYTLIGLKKDFMFIPDLETGELDTRFASIKKLMDLEKSRIAIEKIKKGS